MVSLCSNVHHYFSICYDIKYFVAIKNLTYYFASLFQNFTDRDNLINAQNKYDAFDIFMSNLGK